MQWRGSLICCCHSQLTLHPTPVCTLLPPQLRLVFHPVLHRGGGNQAWHYAGSLLGMRHDQPQLPGSSSGSGGRRG